MEKCRIEEFMVKKEVKNSIGWVRGSTRKKTNVL